ncbi:MULTISPECIES: Pycsar system effector family protein [unclassified Flavobacterium]|uniref:Pycsar system effector family protein n=1 Tax=unclassified Flavobacterium TaxID=196869 RepID=UPI003F930942
MNLIEQAEEFIYNLLKDNLSELFTYHNFNHTLDVVNAVKELAENENIDQTDSEILQIAAWFHDCGYIHGSTDHEDLSIVMVTNFLKEQEVSESVIAKVCSLINATKYSNTPKNILEQIIRDADYYHFSTDNYLLRCELLRTEWEKTQDKFFTDTEWANENLKMLSEHHTYYTAYAKANWEAAKQNNITLIKDIIKKLETNMDEKKVVLKKKKKKKAKKPDRGIDTLFRITLNNHTRLSGIADSKANILLSVNAIIISIALSSLIPKLDSIRNAHLVYPTFIMLLFSVVSIIFAILSTRPKVTSGTFTRQDIADKKVNLLFFGNFYKMPLEEYEWAVNEMMNDREYLYNSLIKDLYFLGLVLERKYKLLRITYNIFMIGLIISFIAFIIAFNWASI